MKTITETWYQANDGKRFTSEKDCVAHEAYQADLQKRLRTFSVWDQAELEQLIIELKEARQAALNPDIVDTMGSCQARAVLYMKGVCERFVRRHDSIRMI